MTIRRLDVFFRTQLTLDQPQFFNSVTNLALAPLQHLVGKNPFESLKGKVYDVELFPPSDRRTFFKVIVFVGAFFLAIVLTPIGVATRYLSFRSPRVEQAYSHAFLLQIAPFERTDTVMKSACVFIQKMTDAERTELLNDLPEDLTLAFLSLSAHQEFTNALLFKHSSAWQIEVLKKLPAPIQSAFLSLDTNAEFSKNYLREVTEAEYALLMPHLPVNLMELYQAQKVEKEKKESLDKYLTRAIQSLEKLNAGLKSMGPGEWIEELRGDVFYPFPFYLAGQLENNPQIIARADRTLWERFTTLRQSCFPNVASDDELLQTTKAKAHATLSATFKPNAAFFKALREKLESDMKTTEIQGWIDEQRRKHNYSYPFHTQPRVLKLLGQMTTPEKLRPFSETLAISLDLLNVRGLGAYSDEKSPHGHATVYTLMQAMDQLENISKLQELIKTQTA